MLTIRNILSAAAAVSCLSIAACGEVADQRNTSTDQGNAADRQAVPKSPLATPERPLVREQVLLAAARAASDFAAGVDDSEAQNALDGRRFEFRIRFGCDGESGHSAAFDWAFDAATQTLKLSATPTLSAQDDPVRAIAGEAFEAVEGFWIDKPWLLAPACPRVAAGKPTAEGDLPDGMGEPSPEATEQASVGIAQFFSADDARTFRRSGRAYALTQRLEAGTPPAGGFDLVIAGRLKKLPNGRVIACTSSAAGERPACILSVEFGRVVIERADTGEELAQWGAA